MKITPREVLGDIESQKVRIDKNPLGSNFNDILQKTIESTQVSREQPTSPPPVHTVPDVHLDPISSWQKTPVIHKVERLLNVLENYQTKLADPTVSLRDLYPLVARMEDETGNLLPLLDSLPGGDELRNILNKALIRSTVEVTRFKRGDYLTP